MSVPAYSVGFPAALALDDPRLPLIFGLSIDPILAPLLVDDGIGGLETFDVDDGAGGVETFDVLAL